MVVHAAACGLVLALGFDHVSDDDYARVTLAQAFAYQPRLDPTGTSWLPFPFWALGGAMAAFGRSLSVARGASIAFSSLAAALPYLALRSAGATRGRALLAVAFAVLSPWSLWLGAATVPESFTASLTAAAAIALGGARTGAARPKAASQLAFALGLLAACLSRYEPWPVAAVLAVVLAMRARRERSASALLAAAVVAAGPLAWMAWNAHAHGSPLHFFERVARFKRALGEGSTDTLSALLLYPRLLVVARPDVLVAAAAALGCARWLLPPAAVRARWLTPLACAGAQLAFLAYGNARDGAPAHHAERPLLGIIFLLAMFAGDVLPEAWKVVASARARTAAFAVVTVLVALWACTFAAALRDTPGASAAEDRAPQLAAGDRLRQDGAAHLVVTPCAFEHFALVAAFRAPERVETLPRTGAPVVAACPAVERR